MNVSRAIGLQIPPTVKVGNVGGRELVPFYLPLAFCDLDGAQTLQALKFTDVMGRDRSYWRHKPRSLRNLTFSYWEPILSPALGISSASRGQVKITFCPNPVLDHDQLRTNTCRWIHIRVHISDGIAKLSSAKGRRHGRHNAHWLA
jgi:hypothetical protein